jgi:hypothetical protein
MTGNVAEAEDLTQDAFIPQVSSPASCGPPQTAKEVKDLLAEVVAGVRAGQLGTRTGSVIAYLSTALLKAMETADLEERLAALEDSSKKR